MADIQLSTRIPVAARSSGWPAFRVDALMAFLQANGLGAVTGSWVPTVFDGFAVNPVMTIYYRIYFGMVTLYLASDALGTSNATLFNVRGNGGPVEIRPSALRSVACTGMRDNGVLTGGVANLDTAGNIILYHGFVDYNAANTWTAAGSKGMSLQWTVTYPL